MIKDLNEKKPERILCTKCLRALKACYCEQIKPFHSPFELVMLIHPLETKNKTGTGRLTFQSFKNAHLLRGVDFTEDITLNRLLNDSKYFPVLLYPGPDAIELDKVEKQQIAQFLPHNKIPLVIVIDGTWPCAKTMMRKSKNLHELQRISFTNTKESEFMFKLQPHKACLSTVESIHTLLEIFKTKDIGKCLPENGPDDMLQSFKWLVNYQKEAASDPTRQRYRAKNSFRDARSIPKPKKWEKRNLFYVKVD